jgi:ubiquinone/menaquinone biosynthesis C-methylase UbiE
MVFDKREEKIMQLQKIVDYWNMRAEGFSLSNIDQMQGEKREFWQKRLGQHIPPRTGLKCLDFGCGPGIFSIFLAKWGHEVWAIDYTENMLEYAEKNARAENVSVHFLRMNVQELSFEDNTFDCVVSRNVTWNLEQPEKAYSEALRVTKGGGWIVNFDGNHNLHLFNELYMEYRNSDAYVDPHKKEFVKDVDLKIMEEISKTLPLSLVERPGWDSETLIRLGAKHIALDINREEFTSKVDGEKKSIIKDFCVRVQK